MNEKTDITMKKDFLNKIKEYLLEKRIECAILLVLFVLGLFFASPLTADKHLIHDSPYNHVAGDMFWISGYAEAMKDTGSVTVMPEYLTDGIKNVAVFRPPLSPISFATLSKVSGIEIYDIQLNSNLLFAFLFVIILYFIAREVSFPLAVLSVPAALLILKWPFNYFILWGMQMSNFNLLFFMLAVLSLFYTREKLFVIVMALLAAGGAYAHAREMIMLIPVSAIYLILVFVDNKSQAFVYFKKLLKSAVLAFILYLPYFIILIILPDTKNVGQIIGIGELSKSASRVVFSDLGVFNYLFLAGAALLPFLVLFRKLGFEGKILFSYVGGTIFSSFFTLLGNKVTQIRHYIPLFVAPLVGLSLLQIHKILKKSPTVLLIGIFALSVFVGANHLPQSPPPYPISNPLTYESFRFVSDNTPENSTFLVLYGDNFYQETLFYFLKRKTHLMLQQELNKLIRNNSFYLSEIPVKTVAFPFYVIRKGLFDFEQGEFQSNKIVDVCDYDYVYFNIRSGNPELEGFNRQLREYLLSRDFKEVYQNDLVTILENGAC